MYEIILTNDLPSSFSANSVKFPCYFTNKGVRVHIYGKTNNTPDESFEQNASINFLNWIHERASFLNLK